MEDLKLEMVIITGLSGAGKSTAIATFEDMEYFCIDNLPPQMLPGAVELFSLQGSRVEKVALVFDVRSGSYFADLDSALVYLSEAEIPFHLLFLEASNETLVARFQSSRRPHPLSRSGLVEGIERERNILSALRDRASMVIDTSDLSPWAFRRQLEEALFAEKTTDQLSLSLVSFGFKYGLPKDADMVFDARFISNPYWIPNLRPLTGLNPAVRDFVLAIEESRLFLDKTVELVQLLSPKFVTEQKLRMMLAVGCTGGQHRSVVLVEELRDRLQGTQGQKNSGVVVNVSHRDIDKG